MISKVRSPNKLILPKLSIDPLRGYCPLITIFRNLFIIFANFKKSSSLKLLNGFEWNLAWLFLSISCTKCVLRFLICQKTWLPLLKIEHRGQMQFLAYISKTKAFRANLKLGHVLSALKFSDESNNPLLGCCHLIGNFKEILPFLVTILNTIIGRAKLNCNNVQQSKIHK